MSRLNPDIPYDSPLQAIPEILRLWTESRFTNTPGVVIKYNASTRRAVVRCAFKTKLADGTTRMRPRVFNVPVQWPGGDRWSMTGTLVENDLVMLCYMHRGPRGVFEEHQDATPDTDGLMSESGPVAVPWFGPRPADPIDPPFPGLGIQNFDNPDEQRHVYIGVDKIEARWNKAVVDVRDGQVLADVEDGNSFVRVRENEVRAALEDGTSAQLVPGSITATSPNGTISATASTSITLSAGGSSMTISSTGVDFTGPHVRHAGTFIDAHHKHSYITPLHPSSAGTTGTPTE